jgi:hypothetical protein
MRARVKMPVPTSPSFVANKTPKQGGLYNRLIFATSSDRYRAQLLGINGIGCDCPATDPLIKRSWLKMCWRCIVHSRFSIKSIYIHASRKRRKSAVKKLMVFADLS